jgi:hypothetical protein
VKGYCVFGNCKWIMFIWCFERLTYGIILYILLLLYYIIYYYTHTYTYYYIIYIILFSCSIPFLSHLSSVLLHIPSNHLPFLFCSYLLLNLFPILHTLLQFLIHSFSSFPFLFQSSPPLLMFIFFNPPVLGVYVF